MQFSVLSRILVGVGSYFLSKDPVVVFSSLTDRTLEDQIPLLYHAICDDGLKHQYEQCCVPFFMNEDVLLEVRRVDSYTSL